MKKTILKRAGKCLLYLVMAVLAVSIVLGICTKATGKVFGAAVMWVLTDSMEDTIPARSYILVTSVEPKDIQVGDIITFYSRDHAISGSLNSHRVIEIIGDHEEFRTKGDHNPMADTNTVQASDIVARYSRNLPVLTFFGRLFATAGGLIVTFVMILLVSGAWLALHFLKISKAENNAEIEKRVAEEVRRLQRMETERQDKTQV